MGGGMNQGMTGYGVQAEEKNLLHKAKIRVRKNIIANQGLKIAMPQKS